MIVDKIGYMDKLYYLIGQQATDFEIQIQNKDSFMSKRKKYSDYGFNKIIWFLQKANARTILKNEIVLDIDQDKNESDEQFTERIKNTVKDVMKIKSDYWGVFESNNGVHIHLFYKGMFKMTEYKRKKFRDFMCKKYKADLQKNSERVTIAMEFAPHWKSKKIKEMIGGNLYEEQSKRGT